MLSRNPERFEMITDGKVSFVEYIEQDEHTLALIHTEVPEELEGQGVGSALVKSALHYAEENHLSVIPNCPFVAAYIRRHPEYLRGVPQHYHAMFSR